jgi:hypothetical protein
LFGIDTDLDTFPFTPFAGSVFDLCALATRTDGGEWCCIGRRAFADAAGPGPEITDAEEFTPFISGSMMTLLSFSCNRSCEEADFAFSFLKIDEPGPM